MNRNRLLMGRMMASGLLLALLLGLTGCSKEARKEKHLQKANRFYTAEQYDKAEVEFVNVLRLDPGNPQAIRTLAFIYQSRGNLARAYPFLNKAKQILPNDLEVRVRLGLVHVAAGETAKAREEAAFVLSKVPDHAEAVLLLVDTVRSAQEATATRNQIDQLEKTAGERAVFHVARADLALKLRDTAAAETAVQRALALEPKSAAAQIALANLRTVQGRHPEADAAFKLARELSPVRSSRHLKYANYKLNRGEVAEAQRLLEETIKQAPDYLPPYLYLAQIAFRDGKHDDSLAALKRLLARDPANFEALLLTARVHMAKREPKEALAVLNKLQAIYTKVPAVPYQMALAYLQGRDQTKAITSLMQAIQLDPSYNEPVLMLAQINLAKRDFGAVLNGLAAFLRRQGLPAADQAQALLLQAAAYRGRGTPEEALAIYQKLLEASPNNPQPMMLAGQTLRELKRNAEARKVFEKLLERFPSELAVIESLVGLDLEENRAADAQARVEAALQKEAKSTPLRMMLARILLARGQTEAARELLEKTAQEDPEARGAFLLLAELYVNAKQTTQAMERLRAVLTRDPKDPVALLQMGLLQEFLGDRKAAIDTYERLLAVNPRSSIALNNLANLYADHQGNLERGYEVAKRAREASPNDPLAADTLGWMQFRRREYPWALNLLRESVEGISADTRLQEYLPEVLYHLGMAESMNDEEAAAKTTLEQALKLAGGAGNAVPWRPAAEQRLQLLNVDARTADPSLVDTLEKELAVRPSDPVVLSRLASIYTRQGGVDKAIKAYEKALESDPKSVSALIKLAELYTVNLRQLEKGIELARKARNLDPEDAQLCARAGRIVYLAGDPKWAVSLLQEAVRKLPKDGGLLYDLAVALYAVGKTAEAQDALREALGVAGGFPRAQEAKAFQEMATLADDGARSVAQLARVRQIAQQHPEPLPALMAEAVALEQQGNAAGAAQAYQRLLAKHPAFAAGSRRLALLLVESPPDEKVAFESATKARDAYPEDEQVARALGILSLRRGDAPRAVQLLRESVRKLPNNAEAFYYLGQAHAKLNQKAEAKQALQQALALNLKAPLAAEAQKLLGSLK